jgi:O-6-methylguanine DNA methyltransferase
MVICRYQSPWGELRLVVSPGGLCKISLPNENEVQTQAWLRRVAGPDLLIKWVDNCWVVPEMPELTEISEQLDAYFMGVRQDFTLKLDLRGTPFQQQVWQAVAAIPYATTSTYKNIAQNIGNPKAGRAVGAANGANPLPIVLPCHRVIGTDGNLTGYAGGLAFKQNLLELEGVHLKLPSDNATPKQVLAI